MKAALLTPIYLSLSWVLTVSYQIFTDTAVKTVSGYLNGFWPAAATWLTRNIQTVSFVYAFSWIFVLSSVLPALILGRERSVLVQYVVCLALTGLALSASSILEAAGANVQSIFGVSVFLEQPPFAMAYLLIPYALMVSLDVRAKKRRKPVAMVTLA